MANKTARSEDNNWQVSSPEILLSSPIMDVLSSELVCSRTNIKKQFYRFKFPRWVNIVACTADKKIVFIKQYRFGTGRTELEIPGGAVEEHEPILEAGQRELLEETGFAGEGARIIGKVCPNPALQDNYCYTVLVENVQQVTDPDLDDMEDINTIILPEDEVFALVRQGEISHGLVLNGLMFYQLAKQ